MEAEEEEQQVSWRGYSEDWQHDARAGAEREDEQQDGLDPEDEEQQSWVTGCMAPTSDRLMQQRTFWWTAIVEAQHDSLCSTGVEQHSGWLGPTFSPGNPMSVSPTPESQHLTEILAVGDLPQHVALAVTSMEQQSRRDVVCIWVKDTSVRAEEQHLGVTDLAAADVQQASLAVDEQQEGCLISSAGIAPAMRAACLASSTLWVATQQTARMVDAEEEQQDGGLDDWQQPDTLCCGCCCLLEPAS
nr:hypothetical protein BaRGS_020635 [Batillaria attramentaria]